MAGRVLAEGQVDTVAGVQGVGTEGEDGSASAGLESGLEQAGRLVRQQRRERRYRLIPSRGELERWRRRAAVLRRRVGSLCRGLA